MANALAQLERELVNRKGLAQLLKLCWPQLVPDTYVHNWHVDVISDHLMAFGRGEIRNLIVNIPPGSTKTLLFSVTFPLWQWLQRADFKMIFVSFSDRLSQRDAARSKELLHSRWWQQRFGSVVGPSKKYGQNKINHYYTDQGGFRFSTTFRGQVTGEHAHAVLADDPHNPGDFDGSSNSESDAVFNRWTGTFGSRNADPKTSQRAVVMQRLDVLDLSGRLQEMMLARTGIHYEVLSLPMEFTGKRCVTSLGVADPRTEIGEILNRPRIGPEDLDTLKKQLGSEKNQQAQLQQNCIAADSAIFRRHHFQYYQEVNTIPLMTIVQSWDLAFKGEKNSDYVVGQTWGILDSKEAYLLDQFRERVDFAGSVDAINAMTERWPQTMKILIEDKANGPAVQSVLDQKYPFIEMQPANVDKISRAQSVVPMLLEGVVHLPAPGVKEWVGSETEPNTLHSNLFRFPRVQYDDEIDTLTQFLRWFDQNRIKPTNDRDQAVLDLIRKGL